MYKAYPSVKDQPNRKLRKAVRKTVFEYNHSIAAIERKKRRLERKEKV